MLALVVLGLVACESAASFKFNKMTENNDRVIYYPNSPSSSSSYDYKLVKLNEKKKNINLEIENLDRNIEYMDRQLENLDRQIEENDGKKEYIDTEIEKFDGQKEYLDRETDIINKKKKSIHRNIEYLNRKREHFINEIEKIELEIEQNTETDRDRYTVHRAAVEDNEYMITISLPGFNAKEIVVKSGRGRLVVQAIRDVVGEPRRSFQNIRSLPDFVSENGSWSYKWGVLRIVLPVIQSKRHKTNIVVNQNGVVGKGGLEKKHNTVSTGTPKILIENHNIESTTYVPYPHYEGKATTQSTSQRDHLLDSNNDGKSKEGEVAATTRIPTEESNTDANTDGRSIVDEVEVTTQITSEEDGKDTNTDDKGVVDEVEVTTQITNEKKNAKIDDKSEQGEVEATTSVLRDVDNKAPNSDGKSEESDVDSTTYFWSQGDGIETTYVPNKKDGIETTAPVLKQEDDLEVTTYLPNQDVDIEATTYAVTANGDVTFVPVY